MKSAPAPPIGQKERATQSEPLSDVWTAPIGSRVKCPVCGQIFIKKRMKHYFGAIRMLAALLSGTVSAWISGSSIGYLDRLPLNDRLFHICQNARATIDKAEGKS